MAHPHRRVIYVGLSLTLLTAAPASGAERDLSIRDARKAAVVKVKKLERKLRDTGSTGSSVPGCWRETRRTVGCLGIIRGGDQLVRWRCAVPMTVRRRATASASSRRVAVRFTDTMCAF